MIFLGKKYAIHSYLPPTIFIHIVFSLISGAATVLAFAPFAYWPIQILSLAFIFFITAQQRTAKNSAIIGLAYSASWIACGMYWLFISMHQFGNLAAPIAVFAVILLGLILGSFSALCFFIAKHIQQRWHIHQAVFALLVLPALWLICEWLRGWVFTGLPWLSSGYAHTISPLAGYAPLIGVYGIGWVAAIIAACFTLLPRYKYAALLAAFLFISGAALHTIHWTHPTGKPIQVRLIQGNVPQEIKFSDVQLNNWLALYDKLIQEAPADLIATPETAIPIFADQLAPDYLPRLAQFAKQTNSTIALGIPIFDTPTHYTNSVIGITPLDNKFFRYDKHHLVPFGEFVPYTLQWFVRLMSIPLSDFSRGDAVQAAFAVKDQWVLPNICYEDLFGEEIAHQLKSAYLANTPVASILLNMSNIAWFGDTIALDQHLQISQMRAIETGRPMLRATNTGTTAVISPQGKINAKLPTYARDTLSAKIQGYGGMTLYTLMGNLTILLISLCSLCIAYVLHRRHKLTKNR